jgi:transcription termination/antitermination protein NusG
MEDQEANLPEADSQLNDSEAKELEVNSQESIVSDATSPEEIVKEIATPDEKPAPAVEDTKWYVLRVVSGKERKVKDYLDLEVRRNNWSATVVQVLCPLEKIYKVIAGKKTQRERILYPGYLLLEAKGGRLNDNILSSITSTTGVIHFLGKENPISLRKSEVNKMFGKMDEVSESGAQMSEPFIQGETVKIIEGPFNDFNAVIEEVNEEKKKIKAVVKIFGRSTPVELSFMQVEKIS